MNILHSISSLSQTSGGPSRSVAALCDHLGKCGAVVDLLTVSNEFDFVKWVLPNPTFVALHSTQVLRIPGLRVRFCPKFSREIVRLHDEKGLSIIHDNGLWLPSNYASTKTAKLLGIPLIVSTHGMLEPWALKYRWWKKRFIWRAWQKGALVSATVLHATAQEESENIRALGFQNPIAVIPNGVSVPDLPVQYPRIKSTKTALFLSRIHPVKGLVNLVQAWAKIRPRDWRVVIAGPDEGGHQFEVEQEIQRNGVSDVFDFIGSVKDEEKWELYRSADLFVLPTFSENFGIVVAEALASGLPVITTKGAPWAELEYHKCGWWVDIGVEPLAMALKEATSLPDEVRREMGERGRKLVEQNYSWEKIGKEMLSVYEWVLRGGTIPSCVMLDQ